MPTVYMLNRQFHDLEYQMSNPNGTCFGKIDHIFTRKRGNVGGRPVSFSLCLFKEVKGRGYGPGIPVWAGWGVGWGRVAVSEFPL